MLPTDIPWPFVMGGQSPDHVTKLIWGITCSDVTAPIKATVH